jgi:hypothetical protein
VQSPEALLACFLNIYHILLCHALLVARKPSPDSKDKDSKVRQTRPIRIRIITIRVRIIRIRVRIITIRVRIITIRVRIITISVRIIDNKGTRTRGCARPDQTRRSHYTSIPIAISELIAH